MHIFPRTRNIAPYPVASSTSQVVLFPCAWYSIDIISSRYIYDSYVLNDRAQRNGCRVSSDAMMVTDDVWNAYMRQLCSVATCDVSLCDAHHRLACQLVFRPSFRTTQPSPKSPMRDPPMHVKKLSRLYFRCSYIFSAALSAPTPICGTKMIDPLHKS